jgi:hypothetical protein
MLLLLLCVATMAPLCGKRRPPLAPIERIPQRTEALTGVQRGNQIILSWPAPLLNAPEGSVQSIRRVDVYRVAQRPNAPLPMTEEEFAARSTLVGSVSWDEIRKGGPTLSYVDTLDMGGELARLRYAIRYVNSAGQRAAFSNFFLMEPAARIAAPPTVTKTGNEISETAITITWQPPQANIDGSTPVNLLGYNIYRRIESAPAGSTVQLNQEPVTTTKYEDKKFKFGEHYLYFVRSVSLGSEAKPVESLDSNSLAAFPVDIYPPAAPQQLTIGPAPGRLSLFWVANTEPDLAGYYVYRSTDPNLPMDKWTRLTPTLSTKTTFTDENVEPGKTYYYYVVALDTANNLSPPSEVKSEKLP